MNKIFVLNNHALEINQGEFEHSLLFHNGDLSVIRVGDFFVQKSSTTTPFTCVVEVQGCSKTKVALVQRRANFKEVKYILNNEKYWDVFSEEVRQPSLDPRIKTGLQIFDGKKFDSFSPQKLQPSQTFCLYSKYNTCVFTYNPGVSFTIENPQDLEKNVVVYEEDKSFQPDEVINFFVDDKKLVLEHQKDGWGQHLVLGDVSMESNEVIDYWLREVNKALVNERSKN